MKEEGLASYIEHTLLQPYAVEEDYKRLCDEARQYGFCGVCVPPCRISLASSLLKGSKVRVVTVIGFPLGFSTTATKVFEAENALLDGAQELDLVLNIGFLKEKQWSYLEQEIRSIVQLAGAEKSRPVVKVIIETCYLDDDEKATAAQIIHQTGGDFIKTSTGFGSKGATVGDIRLFRQVVGDQLRIKAAGGIRTREEAMAMLKAGADRIGTSKGPVLMARE